jgi:hypothetical protein
MNNKKVHGPSIIKEIQGLGYAGRLSIRTTFTGYRKRSVSVLFCLFSVDEIIMEISAIMTELELIYHPES